MRLPAAVLGAFFVIAAACGGGTVQGDPGIDAGTGDGGEGTNDAGPPEDVDVPLVPASKIDLLLVVDNSASMGDKAARLSESVGTLIKAVGYLGDLHIGVLPSSLGSMGGDVCPNEGDFNLQAHLKTSGAAPNGVLAYSGGDTTQVIADTQALVASVGQTGCGLEAQLESAYRFLVQPDPWTQVKLDANNQADLGAPNEVDATVLSQRKTFLRPDSALVVIMLTDEDDSSADPLAVGGQGWAFMARSFPGSKVFRGDPRNGTTAPRGTSACTDTSKGPGHPDCTSCGFASLCNAADPACQKIKDDPNCKELGSPPRAGDSNEGYAGYYGPTDDNLNVRFQRMKERYGIDPQYPIARYVTGFTNSRVPSRATEHAVKTAANGRREIGPYVNDPTCTNPIFAKDLPSAPGDELCSLERGTRSRELVLFAIIGGVPEKHTGASPNWNAIVGANPDAYDFTGMDDHMRQSTVPRGTLAGPSDTRGDNGTDPVHGREWNTNKDDLQFACTFQLSTLRNCTAQDPSCDCALAERNPPLCSATLGEQTRGKAYPTHRPLRVARALGERGIVGSICAASGYADTMSLIATRLAPKLKP